MHDPNATERILGRLQERGGGWYYTCVVTDSPEAACSLLDGTGNRRTSDSPKRHDRQSSS